MKDNRTPEWQKYAFILLGKWYFIVAGLLIGFSVGYIKNRYAVDIYSISAQLIMKKGDDDNSLSTGKRGGLRFKRNKDTRREIASLLSEENLLSAIQKVDFSVSYFISGDVRTTEIYPEKPFDVHYDTLSATNPFGTFFTLEGDGQKYRIVSEDEYWKSQLSSNYVPWGSAFLLGSVPVKITPRKEFVLGSGVKYSFVLNDLRSVALSYKDRILIHWADPSSSLVDISCQSVIPQKDLVFLNAYFESVIANNLKDRYESSVNAIRFLDMQSSRLRDSLFYIDTKIDRLRLRNKRAVKGTDAVFVELDSLEAIDSKLAFENQYYDFLQQYVDSTKPEDVFAPNIIGVGDELLNGFMKEYINLKFESRLYKSDKNTDNPLIKLEDRKAKRLEENIFENIANLKAKNNTRRSEITRQISRLHESIPGLQVVSNEVKELIRFSSMYENLLSLMQEKKLEAELSIAQTTSDYEVVSPAGTSGIPIAPDKQKNLIIWVFLGVSLPVGIIVGLALINPKVASKDDITDLLDFPVVGTVWHNKSNQNVVVLDNPRSMMSESFRSIRAKLKYYLGPEKGSHVILVTSSLSGEGKSFSSVNLASMYALSGQKTILIGADLRKPSLDQYFPENADKGLSNYLAGSESVDHLINKTPIENYWFIHAGEIPPNPFELLSGERMKLLLDELKTRFDKIIIDTPPLLLVSDSLPLIELADINLLLVRNEKSLKPSLRSIAELEEAKQIKNFAVIYNDIKRTKGGYGYGYGYGGGYYG